MISIQFFHMNDSKYNRTLKRSLGVRGRLIYLCISFVISIFGKLSGKNVSHSVYFKPVISSYIPKASE